MKTIFRTVSIALTDSRPRPDAGTSIFQSKDEPEMGQGGKGQSAGRGSPF